MSDRTIQIRQIRSEIGYKRDQRVTLRGLRLFKIGGVSRVPDTAAIRGMINKVRHLVRVEEA